jgi:plasmid maintenance system antidote protein VapI
MFWLNMQSRYDADVAKLSQGDQLSHIQKIA